MKTLAFAATFLLAATSRAQNSDIFGHPLPAQKHIQVYGQDIAYYDMGAPRSGQPVLILLHGYGSQADVDFGPSLSLLAKTHHVIALDQIGAGHSSKPYIGYHVQTYVEWLAEFLRTLHIQDFDLLGESLGGWTAALYAEQASAAGSTLLKPQHLILEDAAGIQAPQGDEPPWKMTVSTVQETITGLQSVFYNKSLVTPEVAKRRFISKLQANDAFAAATFSTNPATHTEGVGDALSTITVPTLVVWGAEDKTLPRAWADTYARGIKGAHLQLIENSGHVPSLEQPEQFVKTVVGFLNEPSH